MRPDGDKPFDVPTGSSIPTKTDFDLLLNCHTLLREEQCDAGFQFEFSSSTQRLATLHDEWIDCVGLCFRL